MPPSSDSALVVEDLINHQSKNADDDLGFDPFHETQKALAEMLEKESISNMANGSVFNNGCNTQHMGYSGPIQNLYSSQHAPPSVARHSPSFTSLGLGLGLGVGIAPQPQPTRTRVPPPGFNPSQVCYLLCTMCSCILVHQVFCDCLFLSLSSSSTLLVR